MIAYLKEELKEEKDRILVDKKEGLLMNKPIIGIIPTVKLYVENDPYKDQYTFVNNYVKDVYSGGGIPFGILPNDGDIDVNDLKLCDAFLIPGGSEVKPFIYKILDYAYENKKPVLGICLGMQAMCIYSVMKDICIDKGINVISDEERKIYEKIKEEDPILSLLPDEIISNHSHIINRDNIDTARHFININKGSLLSSFYDEDKISVVSLHKFYPLRTSSILSLGATSHDGIIEAVENSDLMWIGTLYHPEVDINDNLIKKFVEKVGDKK